MKPPPRPEGRGGASSPMFPRLRPGALLRLRTGTAFRQPCDRCAVGRSGKVYELEPGAYPFLKACDGRSAFAVLRRKFPDFLEAGSDQRLAKDIAADPTLSDLLEANPRPSPSDPRQVVEVSGLTCACRVAVWHLVQDCDLRCAHCYHGDEQRGRPYSEATAAATIRNLHAAGVEGVRLTGGEVSLRPSLLASVAEELVRWSLPFSVNTNAAGDVSSIEELFHAHPAHARFVQVSLDGPGSAHDGLRRVPGAFRRTLRGLERLAGRGVPVCVVSMLHRGWLGREKELADILSSTGVGTWSVELPVRAGRWAAHADRLGLTRPELEGMCLRLARIARKGRPFKVFEINQVFRQPPEEGEIQKSARSPVCLHHLGLLTFDERGLSFCSVFGKTFGPHLTRFAPSWGPSAEFRRAWNRIAAARTSRRLGDNPACARCKLLKECQGGCPGHYADAARFSGCDQHARMLTEVRLALRKKLA